MVKAPNNSPGFAGSASSICGIIDRNAQPPTSRANRVCPWAPICTVPSGPSSVVTPNIAMPPSSILRSVTGMQIAPPGLMPSDCTTRPMGWSLLSPCSIPTNGRTWSASRGCPASEPTKLMSSSRLLTLLRVMTAIGFVLPWACAAVPGSAPPISKADAATTAVSQDLAADGRPVEV